MRHLAPILILLHLTACGLDSMVGIEDDEAQGQVSLGGKADGTGYSTCQMCAALALLNSGSTTTATIQALQITARASDNIVAHRDGPDAAFGTADDDLFDDLTELDTVAWVGPVTIGRIVDASDDACTSGSADCATTAALAFLNSGSTTASVIAALDGVTTTAATNIIAHRDGADAAFGTTDDDLFDDLAELDAVPWVGPATIARILASVQDQCGTIPTAEVVFSPQPYATSHIQRVIKAIDAAGTSLDIAMYNLSDSNIEKALGRAIGRGVAIRAVTDNASADVKSPAGTKSARLEQLGINVRYVNKIMHHKLMLVDGPQDGTAAAAAAATLVTGSGNWSSGAATRYDENTLFLSVVPELALRYQREFNLLWDHSRDFVWDSTLPYTLTGAVDPAVVVDDPGTAALFTSANFKVKDASTTFSKVSGKNAVSDAVVQEIQNAKTSIHVASGHLRSRPISEALLAAHQKNPQLEIKVYLDQQEYISSSTNSKQVSELNTCLAAAGSSVSKQQACQDRGFYFSYPVQDAGIALKFKFYAYRWDYTYAEQMHNKYIIIDGETLITGSYNLSDNAEHNTFENMVVLRGPAFANLVASYEATFAKLWATDASGALLAQLKQKITSSSTIPLVFAPMALTQPQVQALKSLIVANCPDVNSEEYRLHPNKHTTCPR